MYILGIPFVSVKAYSDLEMVSTWVCGSKIFAAKRDTVICNRRYRTSNLSGGAPFSDMCLC